MASAGGEVCTPPAYQRAPRYERGAGRCENHRRRPKDRQTFARHRPALPDGEASKRHSLHGEQAPDLQDCGQTSIEHPTRRRPKLSTRRKLLFVHIRVLRGSIISAKSRAILQHCQQNPPCFADSARGFPFRVQRVVSTYRGWRRLGIMAGGPPAPLVLRQQMYRDEQGWGEL